MKLSCIFILTMIALYVDAQSNLRSEAKPCSELIVPFDMQEHLGNRPLMKADVNGLPIIFELHSNAGFSMQICHQAADSAKIKERKHVDDNFGITAAGKVSPLGRDSAFVDRFTVGQKVFTHVPVSIFETPSPYTEGMLGLRWLTPNRVVLDFENKKAIISPSPQATLVRRQPWLKNGYVAIPMKRAASDGRYLITVTVNGVSQPMIISTIAESIFDSEFAKYAQIALTKPIGSYGGPKGTMGLVYKTEKPVTITLDQYSFLIEKASVEDTYAYMANKRPEDASTATGGMLATDFLLATGAIVDFGNSVLYVRQKK